MITFIRYSRFILINMVYKELIKHFLKREQDDSNIKKPTWYKEESYYGFQ